MQCGVPQGYNQGSLQFFLYILTYMYIYYQQVHIIQKPFFRFRPEATARLLTFIVMLIISAQVFLLLQYCTVCAPSLTGFIMHVTQVAVSAVGFAAAPWTAKLYVPAHCQTALMATLLPPLHTAIRCTQASRQGGLATHQQSKSSEMGL